MVGGSALLKLVTWLTSRDTSWTKDFHQKVKSFCLIPGERASIRSMTLHGESGSNGASTNTYLPIFLSP